MPVSAFASPSGSGSIKALYSQKNAAQSRARSVTTLRIGPPTTAWPCSCARQRRLCPLGRHAAVILDHGHERRAGGEDARRAQLGDCLLLVEREQLHGRPAFLQLPARFLVRRIGDDHLGARSALGERVETVPDVRKAVHRGDDDGKLRLAHRDRRLSR